MPLDPELAESRYREECPVQMEADLAFDRQWAITLLDAALTRVADEQKAFGKSAEFELLRPFLTVGSQTVSYRDIARELENGQIKIADFGIAKLIQSQKSQPALTQERQVILM